MMNDEFPLENDQDYQKDFLADWYSRYKLFRGPRYSGKTTLMMCEARRFSEVGADVLFVSGNKNMCKNVRHSYKLLFGEQPTFDFATYSDISRGNQMGYKRDVVIMDEFQYFTLQKYNSHIAPMIPTFIRASACTETMGNHWLQNARADSDAALFDSVYEY